MEPSLDLVALGGLSEVGMNCLAVLNGDEVVLVDCGVTFPDTARGVNLEHPDFSGLFAGGRKLRGVVLTHGHEDHIGALPYLLLEHSAPIFGPPYAIHLVRDRLAEFDLPEEPELHLIRPGERIELGGIEFEPIRVTHSIADATALAIRKSGLLVVHSGDFKIDREPTDGEEFDEARFRALGEEGTDLLLSDSTNALSEGHTGSESDVLSFLEEDFRDAKGRIIVALFASNVHRLAGLFDVAREIGRRVLPLGRSIHRHIEAARATGYLDDPGALLLSPATAKNIPRSELLVLATGTQGEERAAMGRIARGNHPALKPEPGDRVYFSSRIIPGHEQTVFDLYNRLAEAGLDVRTRLTHPRVHVSGHGKREEQRKLIEWVRPKTFVPVHGTFLHRKAHAELASTAEWPQSREAMRVELVTNGQTMRLTKAGMNIVDEVPTGRVLRDRTGAEVAAKTVHIRGLLAEKGVIFGVVETDGKVVLGDPRLYSRGVRGETLENDWEPEAERALRKSVNEKLKTNASIDDIQRAAANAVKRSVQRTLGDKPLCQIDVVVP